MDNKQQLAILGISAFIAATTMISNEFQSVQATEDVSERTVCIDELIQIQGNLGAILDALETGDTDTASTQIDLANQTLTILIENATKFQK